MLYLFIVLWFVIGFSALLLDLALSFDELTLSDVLLASAVSLLGPFVVFVILLAHVSSPKADKVIWRKK